MANHYGIRMEAQVFVGGTARFYVIPFLESVQSITSGADFSLDNVAPMIEFFANLMSLPPDQVMFKYVDEDGKPLTTEPIVAHPMDKAYLPQYLADHSEKSNELKHYEEHAKNSLRLLTYGTRLGIDYFVENKTSTHE